MIERITVLVVTRNEEANIARCLEALSAFDDVRVIDSGSDDKTQDIAREMGAMVVDFEWNGRYPKKRQWCLEYLEGLRDFVFWVDADEVVTSELVDEIAALDGHACGYFVKGRYVIEGRALKFGLRNNKIALMDKARMVFPVVDDLDLDSMGEIEGHYQPVLKGVGRIGVLREFLIHHAYNENWEERHERYAAWQAAVEARGALSQDQRRVKRVFMALGFLRPVAAFAHCYFLKLGFFDGVRGFRFAASRARYYWMVASAK